jgi:GAF domain-containing protein
VIETLSKSESDSGDARFAVSEYPMTERVLRDQVAVQVISSDPDSDPAEVELMLDLGYGSMLMVPVISRGTTVGLVEAFAEADRPWTRTEINRARIVAHQLGAVIVSWLASVGATGPHGRDSR